MYDNNLGLEKNKNKPGSKPGTVVQKLSLEEKTWVLTLKAGFEIKLRFFKKNFNFKIKPG